MTDKQIAEQIAAIREVTARICVSREAAGEFLRSAGIFGKDDDQPVAKTSKNSVTRKKG